MGRGGLRGIKPIPLTGKIFITAIRIGGIIVPADTTARIFITGTIMGRAEVGIKDSMAIMVDMVDMVITGKLRDEA